MPVSQRGTERGAVLQFADDAVEALVALQRDVLRVLIADGAELAAEVCIRNAATTQSTRGVSVRCHVWHCSIRRADALPPRVAPHEKTMATNLKKIVIVGRPNVGKSTLFNRLAGKRRALTHDLPGMTRDRLSDIVTLDDGRRYELTDTGGLEYGESPMSAYADEIKAQAERALEDADFILFVVDGAAGVLAEDRDIAEQLRPVADKTVLVVNKTDRKDAAESAPEFYELGLGRVMPLSAEHGEGMDDLIDAIEFCVGPPASGDDAGEVAGATPDAPVRVAIIGRPNVGKSSLLNRLLNEERAVVSPISGTTRDAIDSEIVREGKRYLIIDTAGIRRKGKTTEEAEKLAVISARKAIERCEIALIVIDAVDGVTAQDATVAGYADEAGKAALVLVNKWDVGEHTQDESKKFEETVRFKLKFLQYAPLEFISAK